MKKSVKKARPLSELLELGLDPFVIPIPYPLSQPESEMTMFFKGMGSILEKYEAIDPDVEFEAARVNAKSEMDKLVAPHSPLLPEEADAASAGYIARIDALATSVSTAMIAAEVASLGQVDYCLTSVLQHPFLRAMYRISEMLHSAPVTEAVMPALRYHLLKQHTPLRADVASTIARWAMGLSTDDEYDAEMKFQGYTALEATKLAIPAIRMPGTAEILELLRRGGLSRQGAIDWMKFLRIPQVTAEAMVQLKETLLDKDVLQELLVSGQIGARAYGDRLVTLGYGTTEIGALSRVGWKYPDVSTAMTLLRRGMLTEPDFTQLLTRNKIPAAYHDGLRDLVNVIPPLPDLVTMAVREAFPVEAGPAQFKELETWGAMQGLSAWWTERYRYMAMIPMDLRQAYENLWRGHFSKDEFFRYLRIADVHERDWEAVYRVAFRPPGIRELGYGYDMGVYTFDDIKTYRRWAGLSEADADKAARAMVEYRTAAEKEAVRREYLWMFARERIDEDTFRKALSDLVTPEPAAELWVERGQLQRERFKKPEMETEYRIITSSEALWAFEYGLRDEKWARAKLSELDWVEDRIDLAVERVLMRQAMREKGLPEEVTYRKFTLAQIRDLYRFRKIPEAELPAAFEGIGYGPEAAADLAQILVAVEEADLARALESDRESLVRTIVGRLRDENVTMYVEGFRSRDQVLANFTAMGVDPDIAEVYVAEAELRGEIDYKKDLIDYYEDAYGKDLIPEDQLRTRLSELIVRPEVVELRVEKAYVKKYRKPKEAVAA